MDKIQFDEYEIKKLMEASGLNRLEFTGLVAMMNEILIPKIKSQKAYERAEARGDDY